MKLDQVKAESKYPDAEHQIYLLRYSYSFKWPYKLKEFEKELARYEIENIIGSNIENTTDGLIIQSNIEIPREKLLRISSFHNVTINHDNLMERLWTDQGIIERSMPLLRRFKDIKKLDMNFDKIQNIKLERREKQYSLHELHSYKGKYYPQLVRPLITGLLRPGHRLLDPFCGCGTTLIEAHFSGIISVGVDLNPIAYFIARTRISCMRVDVYQLRKQVDKLVKLCLKEKQSIKNIKLTDYFEKDSFSQSITIPSIPNASIWFSKGVLEQLTIIHSLILEIKDENIRDFFLLTLSSIVKRVSNWDLKQVRQGLLKLPRKNVNVFGIFLNQVRKYSFIVYAYHTTKQHIQAYNNVIPEVQQHDSRHLEYLDDESFDGIITSPPYATALPYLDTDRLPMYVLGILRPEEMNSFKELMIGERDISPKRRDELEREILTNYNELDLPGKETIRKILLANRQGVGFRRRNLASILYRYFTGMEKCIEEMNRVLRPGGHCCIVIGNNHTKIGGKEILWIDTREILKEMILSKGMELNKEIVMTPTSAYMVHANHMIRNEYIMIFKKKG